MTDEVEVPQNTLRDQLTSALEEAESGGGSTTPAAAPIQATNIPVGETEEQKAERLRDEKGRLASAPAVTKGGAPPQAPEVALERPTTWKKIEEWNALPRPVQEEIKRREADYAKGVSTYKTEWETAKPLLDAMAPFMPELQQHNIAPAQWIQNLGNAHRTLALGSPQQKLQMFQKLANDYGVPLQALGHQGPDPLQYLNPVYERVQQLEGRIHNWQTQQEQAQQAQIQGEIQKFAATHPHFETVRETMAGLLQSNVAPDLDTAYDKAIRLHDDIWTQEQERKAQETAAEKSKQREQQTSRAKAQTISPRSATPSATGNAKAEKGIRANLEAAFDEHASRV